MFSTDSVKGNLTSQRQIQICRC